MPTRQVTTSDVGYPSSQEWTTPDRALAVATGHSRATTPRLSAAHCGPGGGAEPISPRPTVTTGCVNRLGADVTPAPRLTWRAGPDHQPAPQSASVPLRCRARRSAAAPLTRRRPHPAARQNRHPRRRQYRPLEAARGHNRGRTNPRNCVGACERPLPRVRRRRATQKDRPPYRFLDAVAATGPACAGHTLADDPPDHDTHRADRSIAVPI